MVSIRAATFFGKITKSQPFVVFSYFIQTSPSLSPKRNRLTLLLTLCGQKTHRGGLGLSGLVHEEAHPSFPYSA